MTTDSIAQFIANMIRPLVELVILIIKKLFE